MHMRTTLIALALLGLAILAWRFRSSAGHSAAPSRRASPSVAAAPPDLRGMVLRREILTGVAPAADGRARVVVMDWALDGGAATLVAFDDGTTSLYTSTGGGIIGAGSHASVRRAAEAFRAEAARARGEFTPVEAADPMTLPPTNAATFYLITDSATLRAGPVETSRLAAGSHPLAPLGTLAQAVIAALREASPQ
jgi:hypothetical protein